MNKGMYQQLHLAHVEARLPHLLDRARSEQWTYETFLERALAAEIDGREQKALARRLKSARISTTKTLDGFDFASQIASMILSTKTRPNRHALPPPLLHFGSSAYGWLGQPLSARSYSRAIAQDQRRAQR